MNLLLSGDQEKLEENKHFDKVLPAAVQTDRCTCFSRRQPQNILLTSSSPLGDIKIVDFGLSRMVSSHQELREIMGTPEYVGESTSLFLGDKLSGIRD